jgi:hypothetical protein
VFAGNPRWLEISVQKNGGGFTPLSPRQQLTATPYAILAASANSLTSLVVQQNANGAPNMIGGSPNNFVSTGVIGATIGGGGATNYVSASQILDKVLQRPVSEWSYKEDPTTRHIGPMGQDFYSTFNIGTDDKHIAPIDEGGIAFAAIQGLNQKLNERDAEIRDLKQSVADLKRWFNLSQKRNEALIKRLFLLFGLLIPALGQAQNYSIDWFKVAGGGGTSSNGQYSVSGTIGQQDAGGPMTGGNYSLTGGFWSLYAVQTPGAPLLTITYVGGQAVVSWSPSVTGWTLQTNNNLAAGTWGNYAGQVVNNRVTNAPPIGNVFFRLKQ